MGDDQLGRRRQLGIPAGPDADFGPRVRVIREKLGRSQESVAARMREIGHDSWKQTTLSKVEKGQRIVTLGEAYDLAMVLGQHLRDFLAEGPEELQRAYDRALARLSEAERGKADAGRRYEEAEQEIAGVYQAMEAAAGRKAGGGAGR